MTDYYILVEDFYTEPCRINGPSLGIPSALSAALHWVREIDWIIDYDIAQGATITCHVFTEQSVLDARKLKGETNTWLDFPHDTFVITGGISYYLHK